MKSLGKNLFLFILVSLFSAQLLADVKVQATVDSNHISVGDSFTLQVKVSSDKSLPVNPPRLPVIQNVQMLNSWTSSESRSSVVQTPQGIDFKTISSKLFNYQFQASQTGEFVIDPIRVDVGGKSFETRSITMKVGGAGARPQRPNLADRQRGGRSSMPKSGWPKDPIDELEDRFNKLLNRQFGGVPGAGGFMTEPRNAKEAFFILAEVDKTEAYKGEQVTAAWYLYTRGRVRDIDTLKYPTLKGFWKEDIQISTQLNYEQAVVNGIPYNRALLASYALFPIEAGKSKIDSYKAKATIMGSFFSGRGYKATKASDEIPVLIKPLPIEGMPENFSEAVGEFQMTVDAPNKSIVSHQPFSIKVRFEGRGNAKLIELPKLPIGKDLEVYDIKSESKFFKNGQSFKEFEVLLIPRQAGELVIGELATSYFNPKTREYVLLTSKPIRLTVLPGVKQASVGEERLKADVEKKALPAIATEWNPDFKPSGSKTFIWILLTGLAILILISKLVIDSGILNKNPTLEEVINHRFGKIDKLLTKKQLRPMGIEVTNTVYYVLGEISGEGGAAEELDKVLSKVAPSVRREVELPLRKSMDFFGVLGFGPKSFVDGYKDMDEIKKKTVELKALLLKANELGKGNDFSDTEKS